MKFLIVVTLATAALLAVSVVAAPTEVSDVDETQVEGLVGAEESTDDNARAKKAATPSTVCMEVKDIDGNSHLQCGDQLGSASSYGGGSYAVAPSSYSAPSSGGYSAPAQSSGGYSAPAQSSGGYSAQSSGGYSAPASSRPSYSAPAASSSSYGASSRPSYAASAPSYGGYSAPAPRPSYSAPAPSYGGYSAPAPRPSYSAPSPASYK